MRKAFVLMPVFAVAALVAIGLAVLSNPASKSGLSAPHKVVAQADPCRGGRC